MSAFVIGDKALIKALNRLSRKEAKAVIVKGTRAGAKIVLARAKSSVSVYTGATKQNLKVRAMKRSKKAFGTRITVGGDKYYQGKQFYFSFVEFGHKLGKRMTKSKNKGIRKMWGENKRKMIEGKHQLLHAAAEASEAALEEAIRVIGRELDTLWQQ